MEIYVGKQPDGPFVVDNNALSVVKRLTFPIRNSGRNVTMNNWFTSFHLMECLISDNVTLVGTIRKNKKEIPPEFINSKNQENNINVWFYQKCNFSFVRTKKRKSCYASVKYACW